jgi:hypothetical protein
MMNNGYLIVSYNNDSNNLKYIDNINCLSNRIALN